jgi:cytosine/adenosine deaminase-related metal-dependent hydrolase
MNGIALGRLFAEPGRAPALRDVSVSWQDGVVAAVAPGSAGAGGDLLGLPAMVDAHSHARGLHHLAFGARDQRFELWRVALYAHPPVDPYLNALLAFGRMAQAGIGTVMHVYSSILVDRLLPDAEAIARAARDVGIRLAFAVPLRDTRTLGYGDDEALVARHDPADQEAIRRTWLYDFPKPSEYMALVREVAARIEGPTVNVVLAPNSPQACTDALLEAIAAESAALDRPVQTHLLETSIQRQWADATYPRGFIRHLAGLGLLSPRFSGAHGVWLRPQDCEILAAHDSSIVVNTSSNLRLRSGIAPVAEYIKAGMRFALGVDSFGIDDDDDALREMRVTHWLHSPDHSPAKLTPELLFQAAHRNGFRACTGRDGYGTVAPGAPADLMVLDWRAMSYDLIEGMQDEMDVLLTRAASRHLRHLFVAGRQVVRDGRVLGVDLPAVEREVLAQARAASERMRALQPVMARSQATLDAFYVEGGHARP